MHGSWALPRQSALGVRLLPGTGNGRRSVPATWTDIRASENRQFTRVYGCWKMLHDCHIVAYSGCQAGYRSGDFVPHVVLESGDRD